MRDDLLLRTDPSTQAKTRVGKGVHQKTARLRVLATTDIHMQFLGHDYVRDRALDHHGLAGLATMVQEARQEAQDANIACMLFDNGDLLQGSAFGDELASQPVTKDHPLLQCIKEMSYDVLGIGNHDLDHGLRYPLDIAAVGSTPLVSSNLKLNEPTQLHSNVIIECFCPSTQHTETQLLRIGVLSVLPDQTALWNRCLLRDKAEITPARESLIQTIAELRQRGADIVILLAHMGIDDARNGPMGADDAGTLAGLPGIDAIIAGHTHRRLPGIDHAGYPNVDVVKGMLSNRPAVMPGHDASDLALLDLVLAQSDTGNWGVAAHHTELRPNTSSVEAHPRITEICAVAHEQTRKSLAAPVARTNVPLHNFFSLAVPTRTCALVAQAKINLVTESLCGAPEAKLPILGASSAHTAGGWSGPDHFLHIPPGPILRRHLAGLSPYANEVCALRMTGGELRDWLEHTTGVFHQLLPGAPEQPLLRTDKPSFDFDTIYGLEYVIDPTRPVGQRIIDIQHEGRAVQDNQTFVLATNQFRASGGGGGRQFDDSNTLREITTTLSDAIGSVLANPADCQWHDRRPWRFSCPPDTQAVIDTSPNALPFLDEIAELKPAYLGQDSAGFAKVRLTL